MPKEEPKAIPPPRQASEPQKKTAVTKKPTPSPSVQPPVPEATSEGEEPETLRQESPAEDSEDEPIQLPRIPVLLAQAVPPIKYRNRSVTFSVDYASGKKTQHDPVLSSRSQSP